jgi:putative transposase
LGGAAVFVWLKGKSTLMIFERHANLKYKYGNRHFWCRGYYVDTVWKNAKNTGIMSL